MQREGGDDTMMCGCEARPAGGTMAKALVGGGCGHEFDFRTLEPLGQGRPGHVSCGGLQLQSSLWRSLLQLYAD